MSENEIKMVFSKRVRKLGFCLNHSHWCSVAFVNKDGVIVGLETERYGEGFNIYIRWPILDKEFTLGLLMDAISHSDLAAELETPLPPTLENQMIFLSYLSKSTDFPLEKIVPIYDNYLPDELSWLEDIEV